MGFSDTATEYLSKSSYFPLKSSSVSPTYSANFIASFFGSGVGDGVGVGEASVGEPGFVSTSVVTCVCCVGKVR